MLPQYYKKTALVASGTQKGLEYIQSLLSDTSFKDISPASSGAQARRILLSGDFDAVIINSPLKDEFGHEFALRALEDVCCVMLIVKSELFHEAVGHIGDSGVMVVQKPVSKEYFYQTVRLMEAAGNQMKNLEEENKKLQVKLEEMKVVSRAKCLLVEYLRMSEEQAHKYIERQAMDMRTSRRAVAEGIIKTYSA